MRHLIVLFSASALSAATIDVNDLRVGLGAYSISDTAWSESYSAGPWSTLPSVTGAGTDWNGHGSAAFSIVYTQGHLPRGGGFIWAAGCEVNSESHRSTVLGFPGQDVGTATFAFLGRLGYGLPIGPRVHLECMPELHLGWMDTDVFDTDGYVLERASASGGFIAGGLHLGAYVTVDHNTVLGASFGVRRCAGHYSATFDSTGGYVDGALYFTQWGGQLEFGVRF